MSHDPIQCLQDLYAKLPELDCRCCGECCVSPTCTLVEFVYLLRHAVATLPPERLSEAILVPPTLHPGHEGNLRCPFIRSNLCSVHPGRTGSCRIFGLPALEQFGVTDMATCKNEISVVRGTAGHEFIAGWIERLFDLNRTLYGLEDEPYFIRGLNVECWLDLYFDRSLDFEVFSDIRRHLDSLVDLTSFAPQYKPRTGLREKIDKISVLSAMIGSGDARGLREVLVSIRDDYPLTGTYFYDESRSFLQALSPSPATAPDQNPQ